MAIYFHDTCQKAKSLPQQQTGEFSNIYHKPHNFYDLLDLKKVVKY